MKRLKKRLNSQVAIWVSELLSMVSLIPRVIVWTVPEGSDLI